LERRAMLQGGMAIKDRRERERAARRRLIITTARELAEAEGWDAVTKRRLSTEIEYSQPVLYKHFTGMEQIAEAVAIDGFAELADVCSAARSGAGSAGEALTRMAHAYLNFARDNPAIYDALFTRATTLRFAAEDTPPQLWIGFLNDLFYGRSYMAGPREMSIPFLLDEKPTVVLVGLTGE